MSRDFIKQNRIAALIVMVGALIFSLVAIAESPKAKVSVSDPECAFLSLSTYSLNSLSSNQKLLFDEACNMVRSNNLIEAASQFRKLSHQVKIFEVEYNLGLIYAKQGNLQKAETALIESIKMYPKQREAYKILSKIQKILGKDADAASNMQKYIRQ